ncbi:MAG TPA: nitroreductase family protein [Nitrospirota bacterium]|nr:nitroreductase family protein [Nitrospirota bacterium]
MEVLEAIQKRRTVRVPFNGESVPDEIIQTLLEVSKISPSDDPVSWRLTRVDDETKKRLARIVQEDFGDYFQKDGRRFKQVFSEYPKWLRFSEAQDGIRLSGFPKIAQYFYRLALGRRFGPMFGKMGIMNAEIKSYCRNIIANPALFGVFLDKRIRSAAITPIINTGSMLQNLRLAATALGLCYQDLGWISATKTASDKARKLLGMSDNYAAVNFFRIGYTDKGHKQSKRSDFRRDLKDIVHRERFGNGGFRGQPAIKTGIQLIDAIRGPQTKRDSQPVSEDELAYILEAARWAPTGFNVQPFEFIVTERKGAAVILVLENRERRDPDPGPCEALARGGVLQNIRLAMRALDREYEMRKPVVSEEEMLRKMYFIPPKFSVVGVVEAR